MTHWQTLCIGMVVMSTTNISSDWIARYRQLLAPTPTPSAAQTKSASEPQAATAPAPAPTQVVPGRFGSRVVPVTSIKFDANQAQQVLAAQSTTGTPSASELM